MISGSRNSGSFEGKALTGTTQQLKQQINKGLSGDKVPVGSDPGLATLGTDDEAAGTPSAAEQVELAQRLEQSGVTRPPPERLPHARLIGF